MRQEGKRRDVALFDLAIDPGEWKPLPASTSAAATLAAELARRVAAAMSDRSVASDTAPDDETRSRLRGLGYAR